MRSTHLLIVFCLLNLDEVLYYQLPDLSGLEVIRIASGGAVFEVFGYDGDTTHLLNTQPCADEGCLIFLMILMRLRRLICGWSLILET